MPPRILLLTALLAGCAGAAPPAPVPEAERPAAACLVATGAADSGEALLVAAAAAADTGLLSTSRIRTPVGFDCGGRPVPRIAQSWSAGSGGRDWTLVVPSSAALANAWRGSARAGTALRLAGATSYLPLDDRRLVVSFSAPHATVPPVFADPALAAGADGAASRLRALPPAADLRDAVDQRADLVITGDPAVADYAERRGGYAEYPLPWSRAYVLLTTAEASLPAPDSAGFRDALARDAVRTWARGSEGVRWWEGAECGRPAGAPAPPTSPAPAVIYPASDAVARALAERIVATARAAGVARAIPDGQLGGAIARGLGTAFVVPVPLAPLVPCREIASWPESARVVPLVDTRRMALVRMGAPPFRVDYDGGIVPLEAP